MAEADDNLTKQVEEVEALSSIYGDEWCVLDEAARQYCILITDGSDNTKSISLQIRMPLNYPNEAPPEYELSAPWLRREDRKELEDSLQEIYCDNIGEIIIHLWIARVQEFLESLSAETVEEAMTDEFVPPVVVSSMKSKAHPSPDIHHGEPFTDRKSKFQAHIAHVTHISQVQLVMDQLLSDSRVAAATHNITAYRICKDEEKLLFEEDSVDDGEIHAGSRLQHLLQKMDARNVMIIVTRWYGGIHLGPDRFRHINSLAKTLLEECGYSRDKSEKKGPKSGRKKGR